MSTSMGTNAENRMENDVSLDGNLDGNLKDLEIKYSHHEVAIEELQKEVFEQHKTIEKLESLPTTERLNSKLRP